MATNYASVAARSPMPLATMDFVVKPTATGNVILKGAGFSLSVNGTVWYNCAPGTGGGPSMTLTVATGTSTATTSASNSPTTSNSPTNTQTSSSPKPTKTTTHYKTITPSRKSQTPKAGADTGFGGDMGPDGRIFILAGGALIGAAAVGGLVMRRRSVRKG
ncbi:hypothetical protein HII36_02725 [Nonomuraea sp. NN258]|uniref:hypothetical protein n=1 Tax=Nonomuraea antri TaxID=2730852 RepID=UPI001568A5CE|nr:hypothetical protein [Nonomuraea antri]NRQ30753.1 hypothetical protein [Nonomuraea antri]